VNKAIHTEVASFLLLSMAFNYGSTRKHLYHICLGNSIKMQCRTAIWILDAFHNSPSFGIEAITELIPINLHLYKLSGRTQLRAHSLPYNHIL